MKLKRHIGLGLGLVLGLLIWSGCETVEAVKRPFTSEFATVKTNYDEDPVELRVEASSNVNSRNAIGHMRNEEWTRALEELKLAESAKPNDPKVHFALGVAREKLGDQKLKAGEKSAALAEFEQALEHYKSANAKANDSQYSSSRERAESKVKKAK